MERMERTYSGMIGKFNSLRDQVVYRHSLDGFDESIGDDQTYGMCHTFVQDLYGRHYIVTKDSQGFVTVESFATTFVDHDGIEKRSAEAGNRWLELFDAYNEWDAMSDMAYEDEDGWRDVATHVVHDIDYT